MNPGYHKERLRKIRAYADQVDREIEEDNAKSPSVIMPLLFTVGLVALLFCGVLLLR